MNPRGLRLLASTGLAVGGVTAAFLLVPPDPTPSGAPVPASAVGVLRAAHDRAARAEALAAGDLVAAEALPHVDGPGSAPHRHDDPATKNLLSRAVPAPGEDTADPTTPAQARRGVATVEAQRAEPDPRLVRAPAPPARRAVPQDRYAMAGGCYALQAPDGRWVTRQGTSYDATAADAGQAEPFHFQATDLGSYLLYDTTRSFPTPQGRAGAPGPESTWTVRRDGSRFTFRQGATSLLGASGFALRRVTGCAAWPEIGVDITGRPFAGATPYQEVRGVTDAHTHGMAFEFLGGDAHCGRPWSPYGVTVALVDCPDHTGNGVGAVLENLTRTGSPVGTHDPVGWPTFHDWPAPDSLTHEGTYYKWLERAWRGGLRVFVNLLVENNQLCTLYPVKRNSCDDMDSIRLQAHDMRLLERYVDAQYGGPGKGWYRIVTDPFQARRVINEGKLAVVMGIETSVPFGCSTVLDVPECTAEEIDAQLAEVHRLGVRQMELVNKFDNALAGVAGDTGGIGPLVNAANFLETQSFWDMRTCPSSYAPGVQDRDQTTLPADGGLLGQRDSLFGAVAELTGLSVPSLPLYAPTPHCNNRGLTGLGDHLIRAMAQRGMIVDPDHMSVKARQASLTLLERLHYSGVISSHSWSTPDAYPRIYRLGGVVMPYAGDSSGFVAKWRQHLRWADPRYYFGFGYGADINGLGAQGNPRGANAADKVTYPFTGLGGVTVRRQRSGQRIYDINVDGVAHYGLYPDWLQDLRQQAGPAITTDMSRGAEAYLQMWERAVGVTNDACRQSALARPRAAFARLAPGSTVRQVLLRVGQPHERLGSAFTYCTSTGRVRLTFTPGGRLR